MVYSVQVKRLRNEDPLEALVLRGAKRKSRQDDDDGDASEPDFVFRFAQTYDSQQPNNKFILESDKAESEVRKFRLAGPKKVKTEEKASSVAADVLPDEKRDKDEVPAELQSMIAEYMETQRIRTPEMHKDGADKETEDYVYDVYFSEQAGLLSDTRVGYIDIDESEEKLLFGDGDSDSEHALPDDDEDSNAEDFYRNEYPEEEDAEDSEDDLFSDNGSFVEDLRYDEWSEEDVESADANYERYGWR